MNLRLATAADIPAIRALEKGADTAAHWSDEIYHNLFAPGGLRRILLVADNNNSISGFVVATAVGDEWEIENIAVERHLRRRGVASALIQNLVERAHAEGAHQIWLEVRQSNTPAREFYTKLGFIQIGRRVSYYQHPEEDAVCYRLNTDLFTSKSVRV